MKKVELVIDYLYHIVMYIWIGLGLFTYCKLYYLQNPTKWNLFTLGFLFAMAMVTIGNLFYKRLKNGK